MTYKLTLETKSPLLAGAGEGATLIDADVVFHPNGFPYIPARRVKGMLKESLEEVMEMLGRTEKEIGDTIHELFGKGDTKAPEGKLVFPNLYLKGWDQIKKELPEVKKRSHAFRPDFIKTHFTTEIQQTAIGEDGIAEDASLRNYRVLKPGLDFETYLHFQPPQTLQEKERLSELLELLRKATLNWRYAGTRRNRGFGKVDCRLEGPVTPPPPQTQSQPDSVSAPAADPGSLSVKITTQSPVVLSLQMGDQNTVFTHRHITGNHLRGLLAGAYIREKGLDREKAHMDSDFRKIFLSGKVKFGYLHLDGHQMIPRHLHEFKGQEDWSVKSVFTREQWSEKEKENTSKPLTYFAHIDKEQKIHRKEPKRTFHFHNSRPDRKAGRSVKDQTEGGIFYYEALNGGQEFTGSITGPAEALQELAATFPQSFSARMGRSKSAQYAAVQVTITPKTGSTSSEKMTSKGQYVLTLESPLVLLNKYGLPAVDTGLLKSELIKVLKINDPDQLELTNAAAAPTYIEQYNGVWESKSGKYLAFQTGSSFLWELTADATGVIPPQIGENTGQGFGKVSWTPFDDRLTYAKAKPKKSDPEISGQWQKTNIELLDKIHESFQKQTAEATVMKEAIDRARKEIEEHKIRLNNHLVGRMEHLFTSTDNQDKEKAQEWDRVHAWIAEAIGKPAGDALKKASLINDDDRFELNASREFDLERLYWITFFRTLRKLNKQENGIQ